jgi:predicted nucleic-acid-binding Zn-ribbon protein
MRVHDCPTCGQTTVEDERTDERHLMIECHGECPKCRQARYGGDERHESVRLFTPAPNQISGQLSL